MGFDLHDIHLFHVFFHFLVLDSAHATRTAGGEAFCCLSLHEEKRKLPGAKWQQGGGGEGIWMITNGMGWVAPITESGVHEARGSGKGRIGRGRVGSFS
jgi:hypothetical protein